MSEIPALRDALRDTAERHVVRRRHRRVVVAPLLAAACAFVVVLALFRGVTRDEVAIPPTLAPTVAPIDRAAADLARTYAIFRRKPAAVDYVSKPARMQFAADTDFDRARRLAGFFAIPAAMRGEPALCLQWGWTPGGGSCAPFDAERAQRRPPYMRMDGPSGPPLHAMLMPDGVERVTIELRNGRELTWPVLDNGFAYEGRGVYRFSWKDANGTLHSFRPWV